MNNKPSPASAVPPLVDAHVTGPQDRLDVAPPAAVWLSFIPLTLIESHSHMHSEADRKWRETKQRPLKTI